MTDLDIEELRQKLLAGTLSLPEFNQLIDQYVSYKAQFLWYTNDLGNWKRFCMDLLDQNRKLTTLCNQIVEQYEAVEYRKTL